MFELDPCIHPTLNPRKYFESKQDRILTLIYDLNEDRKVKEILAIERIGCFLPTTHNIVSVVNDYSVRLKLSYDAIISYREFLTKHEHSKDLRIISDIGFMKFTGREYADGSTGTIFATTNYIRKCSMIDDSTIRMLFLYPIKALGEYGTLDEFVQSANQFNQYVNHHLTNLSDCLMIYSRGKFYILQSKSAAFNYLLGTYEKCV